MAMPLAGRRLGAASKAILEKYHILYGDMKRANLFEDASSLAFVSLLSLVPSLTVIFFIISMFSTLSKTGHHDVLMMTRDFIFNNLAAGTGKEALRYLQNLMDQTDFAKIGLTGFAGMLVTVALLLKQIENTLNQVFMVRSNRNAFVRFIYFWTLLTLGSLLATISLGVMSDFDLKNLLPYVGKRNEIGSFAWQTAKSFIAPAAQFAAFTLVYKLAPNCHVRLKDAAIGALVASGLFFFAARAYRLYIMFFTNYAVVYGALAAIPAFLSWLYVLWLVTLFGSIITWRSQEGFNRTAELNDDSSPLASLRNHQMQVLIPIFILSLILRRFHSGTGEAVSLRELKKQFNLPSSWITKSVEALCALRYVRIASQSAREGLEEEMILPTRPADQISIQQLVRDIAQETTSWLETWPTDIPIEVRTLAQRIARGDLPTTSLAEFL